MKIYNLAGLQEKIQILIKARYQGAFSFETFTQELIKLGVERLLYDEIKNELSLYSTDQCLGTFLREDLIESKKEGWVLGATLNVEQIQSATLQLHNDIISSFEFRKAIYAAGVICRIVYLNLRKMLYFGQDGRPYLENY